MLHEWHLSERVLRIDQRPLVMGIVNVTPDSFSDGGRFAETDAAIAHGLALVRQGADILDIGGESTRPRAQPVEAAEELRRVLPVVEGLKAQTDVPLSIDTSKAVVAEACLAAGAHVINDVTALRGDANMAAVVRMHRAGVVLMHMQGTPATMQEAPHYEDVVADVGHFFQERLRAAADLGIPAECLVLDPGIGFGKTETHNLRLLAHLDVYQRFGRPVLLGVSRKGFLGRLLGRPMEKRAICSVAAVCYALRQQAVQVVRVHDVEETCDAVILFAAIRQAGAD